MFYNTMHQGHVIRVCFGVYLGPYVHMLKQYRLVITGKEFAYNYSQLQING